jgi:hypothetical protein
LSSAASTSPENWLVTGSSPTKKAASPYRYPLGCLGATLGATLGGSEARDARARADLRDPAGDTAIGLASSLTHRRSSA